MVLQAAAERRLENIRNYLITAKHPEFSSLITLCLNTTPSVLAGTERTSEDSRGLLQVRPILELWHVKKNHFHVTHEILKDT